MGTWQTEAHKSFTEPTVTFAWIAVHQKNATESPKIQGTSEFSNLCAGNTCKACIFDAYTLRVIGPGPECARAARGFGQCRLLADHVYVERTTQIWKYASIYGLPLSVSFTQSERIKPPYLNHTTTVRCGLNTYKKAIKVYKPKLFVASSSNQSIYPKGHNHCF